MKVYKCKICGKECKGQGMIMHVVRVHKKKRWKDHVTEIGETKSGPSKKPKERSSKLLGPSLQVFDIPVVLRVQVMVNSAEFIVPEQE